MANTSFKVDNGLLVVGESDFLGNVVVSRNVSTGNLTVANKLTVGGADFADVLGDVAKSANTVRVSLDGIVRANSSQLNFKNTASLNVVVTNDFTSGNADIEFIVAAVVPGAQGVQGAQGRQGTIGAQGSQGRQGTIGAQGAIGAQGFQGIQGSPGSGAQGHQGRQGHQGIQGALGYSGLTYTFSNATTGDPASGNFRYNVNLPPFSGVTTIAINRNDKFGNNVASYLTAWDDSGSAIKGFLVFKQYSDNLVSTFTLDSLSSNPTTGIVTLTVSGAAGDFFINGNDVAIDFYRTGDIGAQGSQGRQGAIGAQGFQGIQGAAGAQGSIGAQGSQGRQGAIGAQGSQGRQGTIGAQGAIGAQGFQGIQGGFGAQGFQGIQGASGAQGSQGRQGAVGAQGAPGVGSSITTNDDTTTTTLYPVLVPGTGTQGPKISTPKLFFNASSGDLRVTGNTSTTLKAYTEAITFANVTSGAYSANLALTNIFDITLSRSGGSSTTITLTNVPVAGTGAPATFVFRQSSTVANTVTWANTVYWSGGETPVLATGTSGKLDVVTIYAIAGSSYFLGAHSLADVGPAPLP